MSASADSDRRAKTVARLRELIAVLEAGDDAAFEEGLDLLAREREDGVFSYVARLTRELHQAVTDMRLDEQLTHMTGDAIPDARNRLDYVMRVTEEAAHKTLDLVETAQKANGGIESIAAELEQEMAAMARPQADLAAIAGRLDILRNELGERAGQMRATLTELAQAQEYQDISGQIIKKVITLVHNVENALLELLRAAGGGLQSVPERPKQSLSNELAGPGVPGVNDTASQQDADELLASLGF